MGLKADSPLRIPADDPRAVAVTAAIHAGEVERLSQLLAGEPGLAAARIVDRAGVARTLLHIVADWPGHFPGGAETVAALIAAGADPDAGLAAPAAQAAPETPLHWAASSNDIAVLDALLNGGADIEAPGAVFTGGTPLSDAVVFAQWPAARRLVERGAQSTLWQAAALGLLDRVQALCAGQPGPDPADISNAFWHACRGGQLPTAEFLLKRGADPNWIGPDRKSPLEAAREAGSEGLAAWLSRQAGLPA